jgi:hypothetical protein
LGWCFAFPGHELGSVGVLIAVLSASIGLKLLVEAAFSTAGLLLDPLEARLLQRSKSE